MKRVSPLLLLFPFMALSALGEPMICFTKFFKGSVPEYVSIQVGKSGEVVYKEAPDDERPMKFSLPHSEADELFDMAEKLGRFDHALESPAKVANMGMKTLRYEDGTAHSEVKFNYSEDPLAGHLVEWFDRVIETEQDYFVLERSVKFDKLGVNQALLELQITYERKHLAAPEQFLPLLDRIVKNESFMHMSRERAAALADAIRNPPKPDSTQGKK